MTIQRFSGTLTMTGDEASLTIQFAGGTIASLSATGVRVGEAIDAELRKLRLTDDVEREVAELRRLVTELRATMPMSASSPTPPMPMPQAPDVASPHPAPTASPAKVVTRGALESAEEAPRRSKGAKS